MTSSNENQKTWKCKDCLNAQPNDMDAMVYCAHFKRDVYGLSVPCRFFDRYDGF